MITRFHVENFKALKDVTIDLTPIHVLIGPNDSGKTSILQAMAVLSLSCEHNVSECFIGRHIKSPLIWNGSQEGQLRLSANILDSQIGNVISYSLSINIDYNTSITFGNEYVDGERVENDNRTVTFVNERFRHPHFPKAAAIYKNLKDVSYCHWDVKYLSLPVSLDQSRNLKLEVNGFGLAQFLDDMLSVDRMRFQQLEDRFKSFFPEVSSIELKLETAYRINVITNIFQLFGRSDGKGIWIKFKKHKHSIAAAQVSEGMLIVLAYLAMLYSPTAPRFLLVEEPENGIHPQRLKEILQILRELVSEAMYTQVIMTTHSPDVVAEFSPEEVTLCSKNYEGAVITRRLSDIPEVQKENNFFTLGEIWMMNGDEKLMNSKPEPVSIPV